VCFATVFFSIAVSYFFASVLFLKHI
jgi:hypothetical protein